MEPKTGKELTTNDKNPVLTKSIDLEKATERFNKEFEDMSEAQRKKILNVDPELAKKALEIIALIEENTHL